MESPHLVFVYGTLRRGEKHCNYLASSEYLGQFETLPHYALFDLGKYPGMSTGQQSIVGEVYRISDDTLKLLDILEDVPNEYIREKIETLYGIAWVYIYQSTYDIDAAIRSGDWCQRV